MGGPVTDSYCLPGNRVAAGEYPGHAEPERARAKLQQVLDAGISSFVDLTTPDDRLVPYDGTLRELAPDAAYRRMSIPDRGVKGRDEMAAILHHIAAEVERGAMVYVHCWSGVGRTGTVVGCWLVNQGWQPEEALLEVRRLFRTMSEHKVQSHGGESPHTAEQRAMIREWTPTRAGIRNVG